MTNTTFSPNASSNDGREFQYETDSSVPLNVGAYVSITYTDDKKNLAELFGQVTTQESPNLTVTEGGTAGHMTGKGLLLGRIVHDDDFDCKWKPDERGFIHATILRAEENRVVQYFDTFTGENSPVIGHVMHAHGKPTARIRSDGFRKHTFICGQSGSGKTNTLKVLLEQLLLETTLRILILDPNSDFIRLGEPGKRKKESGQDGDEPKGDKDQSNQDEAGSGKRNATSEKPAADRDSDMAKLRKLRNDGLLRIMRPIPKNSKDSGADAGDSAAKTEPLRIRFSDLQRHEQAPVLGLNPTLDFKEFHSFSRIRETKGESAKYDLREIMEKLKNDASPEASQIPMRVKNLGLDGWSIWAKSGETSLIDVLQDGGWRCIVVDLGQIPAKQKATVSMAVLGHYWNRRADNVKNKEVPVLLVIDEAHNICPQDPPFELQNRSTIHVEMIAGEGRKFGLYLLLASQRPQKIHPNVITQCDNLLLMRMTSPSDIDFISENFSQAP